MLYLMVHIPFVVFWKIGITNFSVGASKRSDVIARSVFGFPFPVLVVPIPFCYQTEQAIHRMLSPLNVVFYKGDGASEYFWFPAAVFMAAIILAIYAVYALAVYAVIVQL